MEVTTISVKTLDSVDRFLVVLLFPTGGSTTAMADVGQCLKQWWVFWVFGSWRQETNLYSWTFAHIVCWSNCEHESCSVMCRTLEKLQQENRTSWQTAEWSLLLWSNSQHDWPGKPVCGDHLIATDEMYPILLIIKGIVMAIYWIAGCSKFCVPCMPWMLRGAHKEARKAVATNVLLACSTGDEDFLLFSYGMKRRSSILKMKPSRCGWNTTTLHLWRRRMNLSVVLSEEKNSWVQAFEI